MMPRVLLVGETDGGMVAVLVEDATWRTVASIADGLTATSSKPITWTAFAVDTTNINRALIEAGYGDRPVAAPIPVPA